MKTILLVVAILFSCDNGQGYKSDFDYNIIVVSTEVVSPKISIDGKELYYRQGLDSINLSGKVKEFIDFSYQSDSLTRVDIYINRTSVYSANDTIHEYKF